MAPSEKRFHIPDKSELEFLERLARTDPSSPALLGLSRAYLVQKDPESSARLAQEVLSAHPGHLEAALLTAGRLHHIGGGGNGGFPLRGIDPDVSSDHEHGGLLGAQAGAVGLAF